MRQGFIAALCLPALLAACASQAPSEQVAPKGETVRMCDSNGCADVPRNTATFQGTPTDPEAEQRLAALVELAEKYPKAAYDLGLRYLRGDGVERNSFQAMQWMRKSGERGHVEAQYALGRLYLLGFEEMGPDPAEAETWLTMAAGKGHKGARKLLPDAAAAKKDERRLYQVREAERQSWGVWYSSSPYYWTWGNSGWYQR